MTHPTRIAVIGCGFYAQNHLASWRDLAGEGARLVAVADVDVTRAEAAGRAFGVPHFSSAETLLGAVVVDLADIVTRVDTHLALARTVAPRLRGMIVQKPFASGPDEARAIVDLAAQSGTWLAVHENFRFQPPIRRAIERVDQGLIGSPTWARISFRTGFDVYAAQPYLADETRLCVADVGVHLLDIARRLLGEVTAVTAELQRRGARPRAEDTATILLRHETGAVSTIEATYESRRMPDVFPDTVLQVEGPKGAIVVGPGGMLEVTTGDTLRSLPADYAFPSWTTPRWATSQSGAFEACRHFLARFRAGQPAETSGQDNLRTVALVEAAYRSAASGQRIDPRVIGAAP